MRIPVAVEHQPAVAVESILARNMVKRVVYVAPVLIVALGLASGWIGAWSAALGVVVVVVNFLLAGTILSISAKISLSVYHAAALFGFFLRLALIVLSMLLISSFVEFDRAAFGISAIVAYVVLLSWETVAVARGKERNLDWT